MTTPVNESTLTATCRTMHPASVKYTFGFETGANDSWTLGFSPGTAVLRVPPRRGTYYGSDALSASTNIRTRSISGLTVGRVYVFSAWAAQLNQTTIPPRVVTFALGVSGIGSSTPVTSVPPPPAALPQWTKISYSFTATAASHTFQLISVSNVVTPGYWDDILLVESEYQVSTVTLKVLSSTVSLGDTRAPYGEATLICEIPAQADLDLLDTRATNQVRVTIASGQTWIQPTTAAQARSYDFALHHRAVDYEALTMTLIFRSNESLLIDSGNATSTISTTAELDQKSLRAIISTALEKYYANLEPGTLDYDLTVTFAAVNKVINPSGETNATGYVQAAGAATIARSTAQFYVGAACLTATATSGSMGISPTSTTAPTMSVTAGSQYWADVEVATSVARSAILSLRWFDNANATISTNVTASTSVPVVGSGWTRLSVNAVAPVGAVKAAMFVTVASCSIGNILYTDAWMLVQDDATIVPDYFDGGFGAGTYYSYSWAGTAHASESNRVRLDARDQKLLQQQPGTKDWDFIAQMVQTAALRLFCDEAGVWRLVDPATYSVAGTTALNKATNVTQATDTISKESQDWFDSVVVKYSWIDTTGLQQTAYDSAGTGNTVLHLEQWARPYPGPGAAAALLARATARGRSQTLRALTNLTTTPAQALTTSLDATPDQVGVVSHVEWRWSEGNDSDEMTVTSRGLVDL